MTRVQSPTSFLFVIFVCWVALVPTTGTASDTVFYVVRHAEKAGDTGDPPLSDAGVKRAEQLMQTLQHLKVDAIYCTPVVRSLATAKPLATAFHITPQQYENVTPAWIDSVLAANQGKRALIVGHSDTVSDIVSRLTGKSIPAIGEHYDNLFIVVISDDDRSVVRLKYGEAN